MDLTKHPPADDEECERLRLLNPRFGLLRNDELPIGERSSAVADIRQLLEGEPIDLGDLVEPLLPRMQKFLAVWRTIVQESDSDPVDPNVKSAIATGTTENPVAVPINDRKTESLTKRVISLERKIRKKKSPIEKLREQRNKFSKPLRAKNESWPEIFVKYNAKYRSDKTASPDTLRLSFERNEQSE